MPPLRGLRWLGVWSKTILLRMDLKQMKTREAKSPELL